MSDQVARKIIAQRSVKPFEKTSELKELVFQNFSMDSDRKYKILMRIFQALRIVINDEINNLEILMDLIAENLEPKGLGMILTFHSLEQEIVTAKMHQLVYL